MFSPILRTQMLKSRKNTTGSLVAARNFSVFLVGTCTLAMPVKTHKFIVPTAYMDDLISWISFVYMSTALSSSLTASSLRFAMDLNSRDGGQVLETSLKNAESTLACCRRKQNVKVSTQRRAAA